MSVFATCSELFQGDSDGMLQCITTSFQEELAERDHQSTEWLLVIAGSLVFFMQAGFAMLCAGCVRKKNVQNTMLKNLLDTCGAGIAWYLAGYAFAFGEDDSNKTTIFGTANFFSRGNVDPAFWFFQYAFSAAAVTIVAGTLAERCQMTAYLLYSLFLTGFVYPVVVHAMWSSNGLLSGLRDDPVGGVGVVDFAGSGVIHLTGGTTALIATKILGPRQGRFYDREGKELSEPKVIQGHSIALQLMGTMVLWFGWYGFNPGSALLLGSKESGYIAAVAAVNTSLAAASGSVTALLTHGFWKYRETTIYTFDLTMAMNGLLSGLVAITAPCGTVDMCSALVIGMVSGWLYMWGSSFLVKMKIDDAVDAIPVHMINGLWGVVSTGLFSNQAGVERVVGVEDKYGFLYHLFGKGEFNITLLGVQLAAALSIMVWVFATMTPFFLWLDGMGWFRIDSLEEIVGLDTSFHQAELVEEEPTAKDRERLRRRRANRKTAGGGTVASKDTANDLDAWMNQSKDDLESSV